VDYPYFLLLSAIASAIADGNTVVFKTSEIAVNTAQALTKILDTAIDADILQVVNGGVPETTIDKIMFTGCTRIGKLLRRLPQTI
jgi:acyl-CoA reductase-like NAD-dependent aldehyde dehydrogenase